MPPTQHDHCHLRLAELLAALSLVADLGMGHTTEESVSACYLALQLARKMGVSEAEASAVFYTALLYFTGCTSYAHEEAALTDGDDIAMRAAGARRDFGKLKDVAAFFLFDVARDAPLLRRAGAVLRMLAQGQQGIDDMFRSHCEVAVRLAQRLGLGANIQTALQHAFERWDGQGAPQHLRRDEIARPARFAQVAFKGLLFYRLSGIDAARAVVQQTAGGELDPQIAHAFLAYGPQILQELSERDPYEAVLGAEPHPHQLISPGDLDEVARAFADVTDLKVPYLHGHARGVANLAAEAARQLKWDESEVTIVYRAALFHDLGRVGIANGIWEKPGPLSRSEWEQVRLHPYHTERILASSPTLAPLAPLAGMHHERLDGSGYYRQSAGDAIPFPARVLTAADAYQAMTQARPYRAAFTADAAAAELQAGVERGELDGDAVQAVLAAAGHAASPRPRTWPAGLTDREVEVLVLIARGATTKQVAAQLHIAPKTAGHHIQHIYDKIDVSTRAGAAMFAMQNGLVSANESHSL